MRSPTRWLAWLCLSLMLWAAVAESTHNHAKQTESSPCSICVVAHSSAPAISAHQSKPVFATVGVLAEEEFTANIQPGVFLLGIRGPPEA
jgi:hypothetical protein